MITPRRHISQPLASLQLIAIVAIVGTHFWLDGAAHLQAVCVTFCFLYSGYFTAASHHADGNGGLQGHLRYLRYKLAKFYPIHVLALLLCAFNAYLHWGSHMLLSKVMLAHLTLLSSWIPTPSYYFGINPVAWFLCDLFFLYLISPLIIRALRSVSLACQVVVLILFIGVEMLAGYAHDPASPSLLLPFPAHYYLYEFPLVRILDFMTGIVLYHASRASWWRVAASHLSARRSTIVEVGGVVSFLILYKVGETQLHPHWYRAYCSAAPAAVALLAVFVFTRDKCGALSRLLSWRGLVMLSGVGTEIYLLQLGVFALVGYGVAGLGLPVRGVAYFAIQSLALLVASLLAHRLWTMPMFRLLKPRDSQSRGGEKKR